MPETVRHPSFWKWLAAEIRTRIVQAVCEQEPDEDGADTIHITRQRLEGIIDSITEDLCGGRQ